MSKFEVIMPKMGESVIEATITKWLKKEGDKITEDDPICEIATDKVDSEIPSPVEGVLVKVLFKENDVVAVGQVIAIIDMGGDGSEDSEEPETEDKKADTKDKKEEATKPEEEEKSSDQDEEEKEEESDPKKEEKATDQGEEKKEEADTEPSRFYSPLVKNIAIEEKVGMAELEKIPGTGKEGRLTKDDLLKYLKTRTEVKSKPETKAETPKAAPAKTEAPKVSKMEGDEIVEMDRMRRLIADHMVHSAHTSPHVTSFIEVDVTNVVKWREKYKDEFQKRYGEKITFMPLFIEAAAKALREYPNVNASIDGYNVIRRKNINIGMATALPNGNLIVPVIKNADQKNLAGLAKDVNNLANKARNNKLDPDDIQGGTFTITNFGTFASTTGTPIINQPQVAILGVGVIRKKPVVMETKDGDVIAIRQMMILSLAYDHRWVDGALGGMFIKKITDLLEAFDPDMGI
ncbi:MAG: 2-oxo acid dehydrogenase subunit E2 [Bacteroidales bacterium]|nr:2-oxo acid dehydrogenase subunit E2 [Bacteroidales bacterium]